MSAVAKLSRGREVAAVQFGVPGIPACGTNDQVLRYHGLDAASLADRIVATIGERTPAFI